jgi:thiamine-monophosphate kinase
MDRERQVIRMILEALGEPEGHVNRYFESDAEIIRLGDKNLLFTTDEFSEEDLFRDHHPFTLGWNVAVATISDILASGGNPLWFGHSLTLSNKWDDDFIRKFSQGIAECLKKADVSFMGGDLGVSDKWHYTGIVLGETDKPLTRRGARAGDLIFMTGNIGAGNLEAALKLYSSHATLKPVLNQVTVKFHLRIAESKVLRNYANCCIDSSDGVLKALINLAEITETGFEITSPDYCKDGLLACTLIGKPKELLLMGECGEYELVFTIPPELEDSFRKEAEENHLSFHKIGFITEVQRYLLNEPGRHRDFTDFRLYARDFPDVKDYLHALTNYLKDENLFA